MLPLPLLKVIPQSRSATPSNKNIICGPEFGIENEGKVAIIVRALYGGKVAGRDFWHHLRDCMRRLDFTSSKADPDLGSYLRLQNTVVKNYELVLNYKNVL